MANWASVQSGISKQQTRQRLLYIEYVNDVNNAKVIQGILAWLGYGLYEYLKEATTWTIYKQTYDFYS